ncbi:hypothetical protein ACXZ65_34425 [Streptomyces aculeolatus]
MSTRQPEPTPERLDEIRGRERAATKGPWGFYDGDTYADVAADLEMTSRSSYTYRQKIARLEDEDVYDDPAREDWNEEQASAQMAADARFIAHAREDVPALLAEIDRLTADNAELDQSLDKVMRERDDLHEVADKLAYAIAPIEVIGEHSSGNDPWENALDHVTSASAVERLRFLFGSARDRADKLAAQVAELETTLRTEAAVSRAAMLDEAAKVARSLRQFERTVGPRASAQVSENVGILRVADELDRRAAEARAAQTGGE